MGLEPITRLGGSPIVDIDFFEGAWYAETHDGRVYMLTQTGFVEIVEHTVQ